MQRKERVMVKIKTKEVGYDPRSPTEKKNEAIEIAAEQLCIACMWWTDPKNPNALIGIHPTPERAREEISNLVEKIVKEGMME